eukprot:COSAG01_NODE_31480_length_596_cov_116.317907_1_plen_119_part_10
MHLPAWLTKVIVAQMAAHRAEARKHGEQVAAQRRSLEEAVSILSPRPGSRIGGSIPSAIRSAQGASAGAGLTAAATPTGDVSQQAMTSPPPSFMAIADGSRRGPLRSPDEIKQAGDASP